jgi:hypothetical protein
VWFEFVAHGNICVLRIIDDFETAFDVVLGLLTVKLGNELFISMVMLSLG